MQMKMKWAKNVGVAATAVAVLATGSSAFAQVFPVQTVVNNTSTKTGNEYTPPTGTEFGNQVVITAANPDTGANSAANNIWALQTMSFEFNSGAAVAGSAVGSAVVNIYKNTGPLAAGPNSQSPSPMVYTSGSFNLTGTGASGGTVTLTSINVYVPTTFTWTVTFTSANGAILGLDTYGPPTAGNVFNDIWQKTSPTTWELLQPTGTTGPTSFASFGSQFTAVPAPEPGTIAMGVMGLLATGGMLFGKRKNA